MTTARRLATEFTAIPIDDTEECFKKMAAIKLESKTTETVLDDDFQTIWYLVFNDGSEIIFWGWGDTVKIFVHI